MEKTIEAPGDYSSELWRINSSKAVRGGNDTQQRSSPPSPSSLSLSVLLVALKPPAFVLQQDITNYRPDPFLPTTVNSVGRIHLPFCQKLPPPPTVAHFLFVDWYHFFYLISFSFHYSLRGVCVFMCWLTLCLIYSSFVYPFVCERAFFEN